MRRLSVIALLVVLTGMAALPVPGVAAKPSADKAGSAMARFQRDLVNVLILRSEAEPLLGAAMLSRTLPDVPDYANFHSLVTRAAKADDAGPGVRWAQLLDCDAEAGACPNTDALEALEKQAPDNAAVWLMVLGEAARQHDDKGSRAALAKAAAASQFDDYDGASLKALTRAAATLPPPKALYSGKGAASSAAGVRALLVFGLGSFQPLPGFQATAALCKRHDDDKEVRAQCLKLADTLVWGSSPLARSLGLHLISTLSDDDDARDKADAARRDLTWQVQNFGRLTLASQRDEKVAHDLLKLAGNGGTRMSLILAALRAEGIPRQAPADWQPHAAASAPDADRPDAD